MRRIMLMRRNNLWCAWDNAHPEQGWVPTPWFASCEPEFVVRSLRGNHPDALFMVSGVDVPVCHVCGRRNSWPVKMDDLTVCRECY